MMASSHVTDNHINMAAIATLGYNEGRINSTSFPKGGGNLLEGHLLFVMVLIFYFVLQIPVLAFGVVTNILNIAIFTISGQRDSVSLALIALAVSDLGYDVMYLALRIMEMLSSIFHMESRIALGRLGLGNYIAYYAHIFQDTSVVITLFVAVQKCCCVAIPYVFKDVFTPRRTIVIISSSCLFITGTCVPLISGMVFTSKTSEQENKTIIAFVETDVFFSSYGPWLVFNRITLPAISQIIIVICIFVMVWHLRRSANFRSTASADSDKCEELKTSSAKLGPKERRAITAVVMVSVIFVISTVPMSVVSYSQLLAPAFFADPRHDSFLHLIRNVQNIPVNIGTSINIFLYLRYNTKFKQTADNLFGRVLGNRGGKCQHSQQDS